jgi:hypothetical protein
MILSSVELGSSASVQCVDLIVLSTDTKLESGLLDDHEKRFSSVSSAAM